MTNKNDRLTELFTRAQASDYSRKLAYKELRNHLSLSTTDVVIMFFVGIVTTLLFAFVVGG